MTSADADPFGIWRYWYLSPVQATAIKEVGNPKTSGRVGLQGQMRYVTVDAISTGTTSVGCVSVDAMLFNSVAPTSNP